MDAPPEWESIGKYDGSQVAMWSLSLLLYEMLAKKRLFEKRNNILNAEIPIEGLLTDEKSKNLLK